MDLDVLFIDNHLLVVNKPPGLLAQADRTGDPDVVRLGKAYLKERFDKPGNVFLGLVHRLDRPASGVMVLARTSKAAARLAAQFRERRPVKRYLAVVEGTLSGAGACRDHIAKRRGRPRIVAASDPADKPARLTWRSVATTADLTLVEVLLETGRPHQIRLQLAARGHPILGDLRHGAEREWDGRNLALHAYRLELEHPVRRDARRFSAPPPSGWPEPFREASLDMATGSDAPPLDVHTETPSLRTK